MKKILLFTIIAFLITSCGKNNQAKEDDITNSETTTNNTTVSQVSQNYESEERLIENDFEYNFLEDGTVSTVSYLGSDENVIIPDTLGGAMVSVIGSSTFSNNKIIQSVTIPDGVFRIVYYAFQNCSNLKTINIPESVTEIYFDVFNGTPFLDNISDEFFIINDILIEYNGSDENVVVPDNVKYISAAFFENSNLKSVEIPASVKEIGMRAFYHCANLETVILSEGLEIINDWAFDACLNLININIPKSVHTFGDFPFMATKLHSQELYAKNNDYIVMNNILLYYNLGVQSTEITIPEKFNILEINTRAFEKNEYLRSVTIPNGVLKIHDYAFYKCLYLKKIVIPDSVIEIAPLAFSGSINVVVYCSKQSYAYQFCIENGIDVQEI